MKAVQKLESNGFSKAFDIAFVIGTCQSGTPQTEAVWGYHSNLL